MFECVYLGLLQVMKWFWAVVSSFTQEELARLLQFTTGSSQLPPGGFNTLCPSFQIIAAPTHSTLPTAHTWSVRKHRLMYWFDRASCVGHSRSQLQYFPQKHQPTIDFWWTLNFSSRVILSQNSRSISGLCSMSFLTILGHSVRSVRFYTSSCSRIYKSRVGPGCNNI